MTETTTLNDRFPTDPHTVLYLLLALALILPTDRTLALTGLLTAALPLLPTRR